MTPEQMRRRWRQRVGNDERGFTIVETVVALAVMFTLLVSLAYVVTSGLSYQRAARVRQTANGVANQLLEQIRGLPYEAIQDGMLSTDLAGDSNIVTCGSVKKLFACTAGAGAIPGTAETIVESPGLPTTTPLVPHRSATSPNTNITIDGVTYTWATYVSQGPADADGDPVPYRVTAEVGWTAATGGAKTLRVQSLFWSPTGCRSTATHPYAAPCQAFFYGKATVPAGTVTIEPTPSNPVGVASTDFDSGEISLGGIDTSIQQEQVVQSLSSFAVAHADVTTDGVTTTYGASLGAASADSDPNTSSSDYQRVRCGVEVVCAAAAVSSPSSGSSDRITFSVPTTTTAEAASVYEATAPKPCPPTNVAATETDSLACAGASFVQAGDVSAVATIGSMSPNLGSFDIARISAPASTSPAPLRAITHRVSNPTTNVCSPTANTDGCTTLTANRAFGTMAFGGLPSGFGTPSGWLGSYARITNYADSATVSVGTGSPYPTTSASTPAGQLLVYNGSGYETINLTADLTAVTRTRSITASIGGKNVTATFTLDGSQAVNATSVKTSTPSGGGTIERTEASAQVRSPLIVLRYELSIAGTGTVLDLTTTVNLGTLDVDASYQPKPPEGS